MSTNSILRGVLNRHAAETARLTTLTPAEQQAHTEATDAIAATQLTLDHYLDAGRLLRAASQGDPASREILAIRMLASNEFCDRMLMCAGDAPAVRNEHTKQLLRVALQRTRNPAAPAADTGEPELLRLNAGAPCKVSALTVADQVQTQLTLDRNDAGELERGSVTGKTFDARYDRHRTFFVIDHQAVVEGVPNPFACDEHWTHRKGDPAGTKHHRMPHRVYPKRFNADFGRYLVRQDHTSPIGRRLDDLARHLIAGSSVTVISHNVTDHAQTVAYELARRAGAGVRKPKSPRREPVASHHNAPYTSMQWLDDEPDTSMFAAPELDWQRWYWIPAQEGRHVIAYLLPDDRTFLWQEGTVWRMTELGNWTGNVAGPRFLPRVFRPRLWEKEETVKRTVIDSATGDLVDIETVERRHAILPWTAAHAPHWLHRKLEAAFRTGIHAYWLKHPSQAVWRLDWPGKAAVLAELERFKGCTRRAAPTLGITVPVTTPAYVAGKYVPYAQRTVLDERPLARRVTLYNDDESEAVERGRLDPHDWQLREWAEAEMTDAVFAIEGGASSDSLGWLRDGDLDASLAAQLGRDAGQYVAWLGSRQREDGTPQPIAYQTHRQRYGANAEQQIERILGKTVQDRQAKELSKQQAESALLLLAVQEGRLTARDLADIAHRKGFRDCRITTPSGTVKMWAAASQLLNRQPVYVLLDGKPLTDEQQRRLNGPRVYVEFPVLPEPPAPGPRTPDYADRLRVQVEQTAWQAFVFGVLCLYRLGRIDEQGQWDCFCYSKREPPGCTLTIEKGTT